jgi:FkbM family methyltransferase
MLGPYASFKEGERNDGYVNEVQGFEYYNMTEDIVGLFERHNVNARGCIHIGAHDCCEIGCYKKLFKDKVIWVEANPHTYKTKSKLVANKNNHKCYNFAAHHTDNEELVLHIPTREDISSLYHSPEFPHVTKALVKTKKMDTLFIEEKLDINEFNFLNVDVEGAELEVLEGFKEHLNKIDYIFIEVSVNSRFEGSEATLETVNNYLGNQGFKIVEISSSIYNLGWGDAFYIKK